MSKSFAMGGLRIGSRPSGPKGLLKNLGQKLMEQEGVLIVPGTIFEFPGNRFRVGLGRISLPDALERVARFIKGRA